MPMQRTGTIEPFEPPKGVFHFMVELVRFYGTKVWVRSTPAVIVLHTSADRTFEPRLSTVGLDRASWQAGKIRLSGKTIFLSR